jgi:hypothetical protein
MPNFIEMHSINMVGIPTTFRKPITAQVHAQTVDNDAYSEDQNSLYALLVCYEKKIMAISKDLLFASSAPGLFRHSVV